MRKLFYGGNVFILHTCTRMNCGHTHTKVYSIQTFFVCVWELQRKCLSSSAKGTTRNFKELLST